MIEKVVRLYKKKMAYRRFEKTGSQLIVGSRCLLSFSNVNPSNNSYMQINDCFIVHASLSCQKEGAKLCIGSNVFIGGGTKIVSTTEVIIGDHVLISFGCYVTDTDGHSLDYRERSNDVINRINGWKDWSKVKCSPVSIGEHSWIGPNVVVLKGVKIGRGVIIGAGSIVTKDIPDFSFAAGVPALVVKVLKP